MLVLMAVLMSVLIDQWPSVVPWMSFVPLVVIAGLFLPPRWLAVVLVVIFGLFAHEGWLLGMDKPSFAGAFVVSFIVAGMMVWLSVSRARLGVHGIAGESILVDLRDRLRAHGELPTLPEPWHAEAALEPARDESFSGDFVVATRSSSGNRLEIALVDVSGKGVNAGTRALLLSGALGGLLGALDPADFLGAANSYLLRQKWGEGFATAIHLALELDTGRFCLGAAGHPPAVKFSAGSGRWQVLDAKAGPLLGVVDGAAFPRVNGQLHRGDAVLLCTDGVIETRTRDMNVGIDRMLGAAERLVPHGFSGGASRICAAPLGVTDDRGVVLIWRT
ncbi:MAG TPA: PP2C family protein-serine/threonine phosphatase [Dermatophilaceae bacterium]|nr:PP2C family protein-serine/threonine phosphatase [Dermatophilaceae bacterium]